MEEETVKSSYESKIDSLEKEIDIDAICTMQLYLAYEKLADKGFQDNDNPSDEEFTAFRSYIINNYKKMREEMGYQILKAESNGANFGFPGGGGFNGSYGQSVYKKIEDWAITNGAQKQGGCYTATAVYGSYDCPQVWTLRRYRDLTLYHTFVGKTFIKVYYRLSPILVKWFGDTLWFKALLKILLDKIVQKLQHNGYENTPYYK